MNAKIFPTLVSIEPKMAASWRMSQRPELEFLKSRQNESSSAL